MLSLQNLQPNKHDVEDGMSTDVEKKRGRRRGTNFTYFRRLSVSLSECSTPSHTSLNSA